jgi:glycosyltransferase involved in cell wall biosynthesis
LAGGSVVSDDKFTELENKTNKSYDVIIQNSLPEFFVWYPNCKNIGFCSIETHNLEYTPWITHINLMDELWVHSSIEKTILEQSGCKIPIIVIGSATNIEKFTKKRISSPHSNFTFYTIGTGVRKNHFILVTAFCCEFDRNEPVNLIIKTYGDQGQIEHNIQEYKSSLGIYNNINQYKKEKIITQHLTEDELENLHYNSDCFMISSYGEAWCRPALDAMGFGKTPIVTDNTGITDFINNNNGWVIPSMKIPTITNQKPLPYLYTARETWYQMDIIQLQRAMREAYENKSLRLQKATQCIKDIEYYSLENFGKRLYEKLYT